MFEPVEITNEAIIKVIGVGGGGGNAVEHMVKEHIEGVEFLLSIRMLKYYVKRLWVKRFKLGAPLPKV